MRFLRTNTAVIVTVGPFYDKTDGVTIKTALTITNEKITLTADTDAGSAPTNILDNVTGATSGTANDLNYITGNDAGMMQLELAAADTNRLGRMMLSITDAANHVPVFHEFMVLPAMIYDAFVLGTDVLDASLTQILGTAVSTPATAGILDANVKNINNVAAATPGAAGGVFIAGTNAATTITTGLTTTFTGNLTGSVASVTGAVGSVTGAVGSVASGGITAASLAADAITAAKIADGAIDAATFAAGAINAAAIAADAITDAKVASDVTIASVTGAVGSVTGAVGSVTGAVGSVTGAVGSVASGGITAASLASDTITAAKIATGAISAAKFAAGAIDAAALATDAVAEISDGVWDEVLSGHLTSGTTGASLNGAGSAGDPWTTALPGAYGAGTAGKILADAGTGVSDTEALVTGLNDISAADILTTALTESYAADGATMTVAQALYMIKQTLHEFAISGTALTVKKLDGTTTAITLTLNSATSPTAVTRAS